MINPLSLMQMFKSNNPKQIAMSMINQIGGDNPMINNLINMANNGDNEGVITFARNLFKEKGLDFDKEFNAFIGNKTK